jgi:hypothetical protein
MGAVIKSDGDVMSVVSEQFRDRHEAAPMLAIGGLVAAARPRDQQLGGLTPGDVSEALDLSETTFADAAEARVTERLARHASELGGCLAVVVTTPAVRGIVDLIPNRSLLVTDCFDTAVDAVSDSSYAHPEVTGRR